jgi:hypothetical protein
VVETLEYFIQQASDHPRHSRTALYKELLRSQTFMLCVDSPLQEQEEVRVTSQPQDFAIWADRDEELGGVWVPVFPARDTVGEFVNTRHLVPPKGKDFLWMEHKAGEVFRLMQSVHYFAGIRLYMDRNTSLPVPWSVVRMLGAGRIPADIPERYELPVARLAIPEGSRIAYGRIPLDAKSEGKLLCLPAAGRFGAEDMRKLVRLDLGAHGVVWMACRHFLQVLRYLQTRGGDAGRYVEDILRSMIGFEMYGEAEALCEWLARKDNEAFAWVCRAAIYGKTGRFLECAEFCREAAAKYPEERSFRINGARAWASLGKADEARAFAQDGLGAFPEDPALLELIKDLDSHQ